MRIDSKGVNNVNPYLLYKYIVNPVTPNTTNIYMIFSLHL